MRACSGGGGEGTFENMMSKGLDPRGPLGDMSGSVKVNNCEYRCVPIHFCEEIREEESSKENGWTLGNDRLFSFLLSVCVLDFY